MSGEARMVAGLDERIAAAFSEGVASSDVADLIHEAEAAAAAAGEKSDAARQRALDPTLSASGVADARREMEDAVFRRDRLQEAVRRLGQRQKELRRQEHQSQLRSDYDAAVADRDVLAAELAEVYPPIAEQLADLMARIGANNEQIDRINKKGLPDGAKWLAGAELVARGMQGFSAGGLRLPSVVEQLRLPAFEPSVNIHYLWPRSQR
jgi:hypothetical protein